MQTLSKKLEVGETFQVLEGPKPETLPQVFYLKVRAMSDNKVGWIAKMDGNLGNAPNSYTALDKMPMLLHQ